MTSIFPKGFSSNEEMPLMAGRITVGTHQGRHLLCPDGKFRLLLNEAAKTDGSVIWHTIDPEQIFGFSPESQKQDN